MKEPYNDEAHLNDHMHPMGEEEGYQQESVDNSDNAQVTVENQSSSVIESDVSTSIFSSKTLLFGLGGVALLFGLIFFGLPVWFDSILSKLKGGDKELTSISQKRYTEAGENIGVYTEAPPSIGVEPIEEPKIEEPKEVIKEDPPAPAPVQTAPPPAPEKPKVDELSQKRRAGEISTHKTRKSGKAKARVALVDQKTTLMKGTRIPCILESAIQSELDGFTSCIVKDNVYSGDAKTLLIEKGSQITGYYSGDVKNGANRLQVIWDRIVTPYDLAIELNAPTTDRLGASGAVGDTDSRWGLRIGSALLVSLMSDSLDLLADNESSGSNNVFVEGDTRDTAQELATKILEKNIDLPPIISIKNGETIQIYVVDDIDFSEVYEVKG